MTLRDFAYYHDHCIVFYSSTARPMGEELPLSYPDVCPPEDWGLYDLEGKVSQGQWEWDGRGSPVDCRNNSLTRVTAYDDESTWMELVSEYLNDY
jgi:hypothetical protein